MKVFEENKTSLYLAPIINALDYQVSTMIKRTKIEAWGLYDALYLKAKDQAQMRYHLFILHDASAGASPLLFKTYLSRIRKFKYYVDDYIFDFLKPNLHMVILRLPRTWNHSYDRFEEGRFSSMYSPEQIARLRIPEYVSPGLHNKVFLVLRKDQRYKSIFERHLDDIFSTRVVVSPEAELDAFIDQKKEIFNVSFYGVKPRTSDEEE